MSTSMIVGRVIATLAAPHGPSTIGGAMDETPGRHEAGHQGAMDVVPSPMASSHQLGVSTRSVQSPQHLRPSPCGPPGMACWCSPGPVPKDHAPEGMRSKWTLKDRSQRPNTTKVLRFLKVSVARNVASSLTLSPCLIPMF